MVAIDNSTCIIDRRKEGAGSPEPEHCPHVLMIASQFPPRNSAGVFRSVRFARYLHLYDWKVSVLTIGQPWYSDGTTVDEALLAKIPPEIKIHTTRACYPNDWIVSARDRVFGTRPPADRWSMGHALLRESSVRRSRYQQFKDLVSGLLTTPDTEVGWVPFAVAKGKRIARDERLDLIYSSGPPFSNHLVGLRLKRSTRLPWVADFRDPWMSADFRQERIPHPWIRRCHARAERKVMQHADCVILNTERSKIDYVDRFAECIGPKFSAIPNGFDPQDFECIKLPDRSAQQAAPFTLAHAGTFYAKRNITNLIAAVKSLYVTGRVPLGAVRVLLIGGLRPERTLEQEQIESLGLAGTFELTPRMPHTECLQQLANAHAGLLVQVGSPLSIPGKVYEYIALRKPILAITTPGATADIVQQYDLGRCAHPDDVDGIASALLHFIELQQNGSLAEIDESTARLFDARQQTRLLAELFGKQLDSCRADCPDRPPPASPNAFPG